MSSQEKVLTRGAQMRALITTEAPDHLKEPKPEWVYKRSLRPSTLLAELWQARQIIRTITERNLRVRYKQSILGFGWAVLTPIGLLLVLTFVFGRIAGVATGGVPYPIFAYLGLLPWTFFTSSVSSAGGSILGDKALLSKSQFPREVFPLSSVAVAAVDALTALIPLVLLFIINGRAPSVTSPIVVLPLLVLGIFTAGIAMLISTLVVYLRDVRQALPIILQVGLFATPVAYGLDLVPHWFRLLYCFLNPVAPVIDSIRRTVVLGHAPQWGYLGAGAISAVLVLVIGFAVFKKLEGGLADVA